MTTEYFNYFSPRPAPLSQYDSVLLMPDNLPIKTGFDLWSTYTENISFDTSKEAKKFARLVINDPEAFLPVLSYFDEVRVIAEETGDAGTAKSVSHCVRSLTQFIAKSWQEQPQFWHNNTLETILHLAVKGSHALEFQTLLGGLLTAKMQPEQSNNLLYHLCLTSLRDDEQKEFVLRMLNFNLPIYDPNGSMEKNYIKGFFSSSDSYLRQSLEIDAFIDLLSPIYLPKDLVEKGKRVRRDHLNRSNIDNYARRQYRNDPQRAIALLNFLEETQSHGYADLVAIPPGKTKLFPYNLVLKEQGPLIQHAQEELARYRPVSGYELVTTPQWGSAFHRVEDAQAFTSARTMVRNHFRENEPDEVTDLNPSQMRTIINFLRDDIESVTQVGELMHLRRQLANNVHYDFRRPLSDRGNLIEIRDPQLKNFGYTQILFNYLPQSRDMVGVSVYLGNYRLQLALNTDYDLVQINNFQRLEKSSFPPDSVSTLFIQCWILGHLEELLCKDSEEILTQNVNPSDKKAFQAAYLSRIGHTRVIPRQDFVPNLEQRRLAKDEQNWDLLAINDWRRSHHQLPVTYVRKIDNLPVNSKALPPVKTYASSATQKIRQIVNP